MPLTLRALVEFGDLALQVRTTRGSLDRPIAWAHVSELADPTPFLEGGELLLTTGLGIGQGATAHRRYVERLASKGLVGLGLGTGLTFSSVPADLLAAADDAGLPVIEVPRATPFIAISKAVSRALAADEYAGVTHAYEAQQALTRAALRPDGFASLVRELARRIEGWVLLLDRAGTLMQAAPISAAGKLPAVAADLNRLGAQRTISSAAFTIAGDEVVLQSLGTSNRSRGFLAVGRRSPLSSSDRHVLNSAASLLTLALEQARNLENAQRHLRTGLFHLLAAGELDVVGPVVLELWGGLPREPLRIGTIRADQRSRADMADLLTAEAGKEHEPIFYAEMGNQLVVLMEDGRAVCGRLGELAERVEGVLVGVSDQVTYQDFAVGVRQANEAATFAATRGSRVGLFADIAGGGLLQALDGQRARAFAESLLHTLIQRDKQGRGDLVRSLRVWLECHGQWEPASVRLGVHRHTLRHRIQRIEELLNRSLDSPGVRAELWVALQLHEEGPAI